MLKKGLASSVCRPVEMVHIILVGQGRKEDYG